MNILNHGKGFLFRIFPPLGMMFRKTRIVMFHTGRCGSSVLGFMLDEHPDICWDGEILKERKRKIYRQRYSTFDFKTLIQRQEQRCPKSCFGFEMKYGHIRMLGMSKSQFLDALHTIRFSHFIILTRKNYLRKHVSGSIAKITGRYHVGSRKTMEHIKVTWIPTGLFRSFESLIMILKRFRLYLATNVSISHMKKILSTTPPKR